MNPVTAIDTRATTSRGVNQNASRDPNTLQVIEIAQAAKRASCTLANLPTAAKDEALSNIATALQRESAKILSANAEDVKRGEALVASGELSRALFNRLALSEEKLRIMIEGVLAVRELPDPAGQLLASTLLDQGPEPAQSLRLDKVSCPLGVLAIIFEARPDAITQISSLAIKSGNAVILKGGKEVEHTMRAILEVIRGALSDPGSHVPADAVCGVYGREAVQTLLDLTGTIDLVIPRGSNALVQHIQRNTQIPVLGHADGVCHIFIDRAANFASAIPIVVDSKIQYPGVCNAVETILVDREIATSILPSLYAALHEKGVQVRGDARTQAILPDAAIDLVADDEWHTEYSDLILAIRVVDSLEAAIEHIEQHGSHHTDAILTEDAAAAELFLNSVDSANVLLNCSTRFSDGFRYGFGAEVGISTSKLHARGPVGLEGLVTYKYKLAGTGQVVRDYAGKNARTFLHKRLDT
jgi:glutamate-5-semialdehyde dehydrogenase